MPEQARRRSKEAVVIALISLAVSLGASFTSWTLARDQSRAATAQVRTARHESCVQINALKRVARSQLQRGRKSIPTLAYYKAHPAERDKALTLIDEQLREFALRRC